MKKRTKFSLIFLIIFFVLITVAFLFANKWTKDFQAFLDTQGSVEHAKVHDVVITETKNGIKDWEVYAAEGEYDNTRTTAVLTDIVGNYYQNGEVVMSFTAPTGTYNDEKKEISLTGSVLVAGQNNIKLTTDKIYWVTTEKKIYAEGNVILNQADEIIALGSKASLSTDFKNVEILKNAEVRIYKEYDKGAYNEKF